MKKVSLLLRDGAKLPEKSTELAGAYDLHARGILAWYSEDNVDLLEDEDILFKDKSFIINLKPGERICIDTGLTLADCPFDFKGSIIPRSGIALKYGITVLNGPGLIDADYRKEIGVILLNTSSRSFTINFNDRIAQLELRRDSDLFLIESNEIAQPNSNRNGGFGSTGK